MPSQGYHRNISLVFSVCPNTSCYLSEDEIRKASELVFEAGAEYVKTSTGFGTGGATVEAVQIMSSVAKKFNGKVKAAGGIHNFEEAMAMVNAGAYPPFLSPLPLQQRSNWSEQWRKNSPRFCCLFQSTKVSSWKLK